ncbi:hypothetical protein MRB53_035056 [Persea americana]|uniref:Uncharacterized protein n=1 Tax=Persea americana TaxID=3435 RepID=A0ACC2K3I6_PERAE|nr:hypothetical protein MRB53_035056 [Persea americana]
MSQAQYRKLYTRCHPPIIRCASALIFPTRGLSGNLARNRRDGGRREGEKGSGWEKRWRPEEEVDIQISQSRFAIPGWKNRPISEEGTIFSASWNRGSCVSSGRSLISHS